MLLSGNFPEVYAGGQEGQGWSQPVYLPDPSLGAEPLPPPELCLPGLADIRTDVQRAGTWAQRESLCVIRASCIEDTSQAQPCSMQSSAVGWVPVGRRRRPRVEPRLAHRSSPRLRSLPRVYRAGHPVGQGRRGVPGRQRGAECCPSASSACSFPLCPAWWRARRRRPLVPWAGVQAGRELARGVCACVCVSARASLSYRDAPSL